MCAPQPTPPKETSAASTATNVSTAIANSYLGNYNEVTPDGTRTFKKIGSESIYDPYTKQTYDVPRFKVKETLSANQQAIKDQQDLAKINLSQTGAEQSAFLRDYLREPFNYNSGEHEAWASGLYDKLNSNQVATQQDQLTTRLANQGVVPGSKAYDDAMRSLYQGQQGARDQFMLDSFQTGFDTSLANRNQPINEITALLSGSQVSHPSFATQPNPVNMPTTDNAQIIGNYDNARISAAQANMNGILGGISAIGGLFSDERMKDDKKKIAETKDGMGIYSFRYKGEPETRIGLMAQEVEKKKPRAVGRTGNGLMFVDYKEALK